MLELKNISLSFQAELIKDGHIIIPDEKITVIAGKSGSGKSTILYDIALITHQVKMDYSFCGLDVSQLSHLEKQNLQRNAISFVFQNIQLIDSLSLIENIKFFAYLIHPDFNENQAREYLTDLNLMLDDQTDIKTLSGGEKQRLAIVCALMKDTPIIILDEPTAYLDYDNKLKLMRILTLLRDKYHKTVIIATHDDLIKEMADHLYEIQDQKIVKEKIDVISQPTPLVNTIDSYQHALKLFYKKIMKSQQWKHNILRVLLIVLFSFSCFISVFFQKYQERLNQSIEQLQSHQIIVQSKQPLSNEKIKDIKYYDEIEDVKRVTPIETDNGYLICPYIESDYFYHYLDTSSVNENANYANYELYRRHKNPIIECQISDYSFSVTISNYLNHKFEDYQGLSSLSQVIYIPYTQYEKIIKKTDIDLKDSSLFIIKIKDRHHYLEVLKEIQNKFSYIEIYGNTNLMKMIDVMNHLEVFNQVSITFIMGLAILGVIILKVLDQYQWRFHEVLLGVNGISNKNMQKLFLQKELYLLLLPCFISIIGVACVYGFMGLLDKDILLYICMFILIETTIVLIVAYVIYVIMEVALSNIKIIKKF